MIDFLFLFIFLSPTSEYLHCKGANREKYKNKKGKPSFSVRLHPQPPPGNTLMRKLSAYSFIDIKCLHVPRFVSVLSFYPYGSPYCFLQLLFFASIYIL